MGTGNFDCDEREGKGDSDGDGGAEGEEPEEVTHEERTRTQHVLEGVEREGGADSARKASEAGGVEVAIGGGGSGGEEEGEGEAEVLLAKRRSELAGDVAALRGNRCV